MNNLVLNEDDPAHIMKKKFEAIMMVHRKEKYELVLNFMNSMMRTKYKTLRMFKNIQENKFENNDDTEDIICEFKPKLEKKFKIKINDNDIDKNVINLIKTLAKQIGYSLVKSSKNKITYYSLQLLSENYSIPQ